jgi:phosphoribosylaminoimidazole-succinocarboxamide synthase
LSTAKSLPLTVAYEGSVKRVLSSTAEADKLWFDFTDDYSVFDWGKMPDTIENKGRALTLMGAFFFEELGRPEFWRELQSSKSLQKFDAEFIKQRFENEFYCGPAGLRKMGLPNHFLGLTDAHGKKLTMDDAIASGDKLLMQVQKANVYRPHDGKVLNHNLFFYPNIPEQKQIRLIPLEIVFRFGMPGGSSLEERLRKDETYVTALGLKKMPESNQWFDRPVLEFFTKLEPKDRFLSYQEAALLSQLPARTFTQITEMALDVALALHDIFEKHGMQLWDGKIELLEAQDGNGNSQILLADSVGPDELRVLVDGQQLSKEMLRQFYRGSKWETALKKAQSIAKQSATLDWKSICENELGEKPQPLPASFKEHVDALYCMLTNTLMERKVFAECPDLNEFVSKSKSIFS